MEEQNGFNLEKEYIGAVYCRPAYLIYLFFLFSGPEVSVIQKKTRTTLKTSHQRTLCLSKDLRDLEDTHPRCKRGDPEIFDFLTDDLTPLTPDHDFRF